VKAISHIYTSVPRQIWGQNPRGPRTN